MQCVIIKTKMSKMLDAVGNFAEMGEPQDMIVADLNDDTIVGGCDDTSGFPIRGGGVGSEEHCSVEFGERNFRIEFELFDTVKEMMLEMDKKLKQGRLYGV